MAGGRTIQRAVDLATMPIYARAGAIVPVDPIRQYTDEPVSGPTTLRLPGRQRRLHALRRRRDQPAVSRRARQLDPDDVDRRDAHLDLEPGAPSGATDVVRPRAFRVVLPDGRTNDVSHAGRRVTVAFQERPKIGETITTESGLVYKFTQLGKGPQPQTGDLMIIHGIGTHVDGKEFWNTRTDNSPWRHPRRRQRDPWILRGHAQCARGRSHHHHDEAGLAYGVRERTGIPANSTLVFDYEILAVKPRSFARLSCGTRLRPARWTKPSRR